MFVKRDNNQSREHIEDTHNGYNLLRDFDDTLAAAENAKSYSRRNHGADNQRRPGSVVEAVRLKGRLQIVRAEKVKSERVCSDEEHAEKRRDKRLSERLFNVVRGTAEAVTILVPALVNLRERTLDKRRRSADNAHNPHPEARSGTAYANRRGNAYDVACADSRRGRYHQRLKRAYVLFARRLFHNQSAGFAEEPYLCKERLRIVKKIPAAARTIISIGKYIISSTLFKNPVIASIILSPF